ncbi:MAG: UvrB/UvrC motif-containing protein, partial [Ardenticatenia bacterium]|nr:UvrB/UvrC motif-containing protein [Ardenticatenia bacterium]
LDADKEGFLRSGSTLIQTIGRAARHINGTAIMYADMITDSMRRAIDETDRRRAKQLDYNRAHGIEPRSIVKAVRDLTDQVQKVAEERAPYQISRDLPQDELAHIIRDLEKQMQAAAAELEFEQAALLRDQILELRQQLRDMDTRPAWEKVQERV